MAPILRIFGGPGGVWSWRPGHLLWDGTLGNALRSLSTAVQELAHLGRWRYWWLRGTADGPLACLAGNDQVKPNPAIRVMIDRYVQSGQFPAQEEFLQDPMRALYYVLTQCRFLWLLPDFLPEDRASEGWRVLLYRKL